MSELKEIKNFLDRTGVDYRTWTDPECIDEASVAHGAVVCLSIKGSAHLNFDANGRLVGSSTDCAKSHKLRKTNETKKTKP